MTVEDKHTQAKLVEQLKDGFPNSSPTHFTPEKASLRCPHCRHSGVFSCGIGQTILVRHENPQGVAVNSQVTIGPSWCTNPQCQKLVVIAVSNTRLIGSWPREVFDFDTKGVPAEIAGTLEEAIVCHSHAAYRASALMIRRSLEEICADKEVDGKDLKTRLDGLGDTIVIPKQLMEALTPLRLLGNDAAHVEAKTYSQITEPEVSAALKVTKEIVKATYQLQDLVSELKGLSNTGD